MEMGSCGCGGHGCEGVSRREVLAVAAAAAVTVGVASNVGRAAGAIAVDDSTAAWTSTSLKPADVADKSAKLMDGKPILISRDGKNIYALSNKCTHKGCALKPKAGETVMTCQCHRAEFDWEGAVVKAPAKQPLPRYALRLNKDGVIEVDTSATVAHDAASAVLAVP